MKIRPSTLEIGSVITGTLKSEDLLPVFLYAARSVKLKGDDYSRYCVIAGRWNSDYDRALDDRTKEEVMSDDVESLIELLNNYVPDLCRFGAHEGDGADFGVWVGDDVPYNGRSTEDVFVGEDTESSLYAGQEYWLKLNDHGNCALYRKVRAGKGHRWIHCWSVV